MSDIPQSRVTQKDIALKAGVSHVTVSLALRGHHKIPLATRNRILAVAKQLGYSPDPMLGALAAYRRSQRPPAFHSTLAWVNSLPNPVAFPLTGNLYFEGAMERARDMGYNLEIVNLSDYHFERIAVQRVLFFRNISGLLIAPSGKPHIDLDWRRFSAIRFGYSMVDTTLHTVTNYQFYSAYHAVERLVRLGYRRIGYMADFDVHSRTGAHFSGGFLSAQAHVGIYALPVFRVEPFTDVRSEAYLSAARSWINKEKPEVIIAPSNFIFPYLQQWGLQVPQDISFVSLSVDENDNFISGIEQNHRNIGRAAVNLLVSLLDRQEKGIPKVPTHLLIEGIWKPGRTAVPKETA